MKNPFSAILALILFLGSLTGPGTVWADTPEPAPSGDPTIEQRVGDLEAYMNNTGAGGSGENAWKSKVAVAGPGHNAWMMASTALVLFMTLPGLALFYGGLVRTKNVLSIMAQCMAIAGLVTILWWAFGYSLVFGKSFQGTLLGPILGGTEFFFMRGVDSLPNTDYSYWVSHNVFAMYQLMFAIITPALILGAIAERVKFTAIMAFVGGWMFLVYFPLAHMVWGITGLMNGVWNAAAAIQAVDFAGGTVVHMSSGWSALLLCLIVGPRIGFGKTPMPPHSLVLCMVGTGILWVGWYGFNAGSALAADGIAANAFTTTTLATGLAAFTWALLEYLHRQQASVLGFCSGAVAGLVVVTPSCGFISTNGAMLVGVLAGLIPYLACTKLKSALKYDDALDTFGVHAVGGTLGALLAGFLATTAANGNLSANLSEIVGHTLWIEQIKAIGLTLFLSLAATGVLALAVNALIGFRPSQDKELEGLDIADHGEHGYIYDTSNI